MLAANSLTATAGVHGMASPGGLTATGVGLFNIAASSTVNALAAEGIISPSTKRKLATFILVANMLPAAFGIMTIADPDSSTSAGLGQLALSGASTVQCLDAMGKLKGKDDK